MGRKKNGEKDTSRLLHDETVENYGAVDKNGKQKKQREYVAKINFWNLFKYATRSDITFMVMGTIFAIFTGACLPIMGYYFGGMTNVFINQAVNGLIPDSIAQQQVINAATNATPTTLTMDEKLVPLKPADKNEILYKVIYTLTEFFQGNLTDTDIWRNDTVSGQPLSESQFNEVLNKYLIIYLVIGTLIGISSFIQTLVWEYTSEHQVHTVRKVYFAQILRQDISWYDKNEEGNLPNKLADDLERIREGTGHKFVMIVQYLSTFISGIVVGLYVNARMTLVTLCIGPFLVALTAYTAKFAASHVSREQQKYAKAGAVAEETLTNLKTVNAYSGQPYETQRYYAALEEGRIFAMKRYDILSVCIGITFFFMYAAYGLGFWYGSLLVIEGISSPGSIFTVFFSVVVGAFSIGQALPFLNIVSAAVGVSASIEEILARKITVDPYSPNGRKLYKAEGHIQFRDVYFSYPSRPTAQILNGLTLDIEPGKTTAIVGSSGAGKSTIVSLTQRFYDPTSGNVCLDDVPLTELNVRWLRSQIGLVSQEPVLFGVSIQENIAYGRDDVSQEEIIEAAKQANAHNFIQTLPNGYDTLVGDTGSQLSGGQKQRIAIARALVRNPKILLLDEATSALDAHSEGIVQETLSNVMVGRTTVIVAHRLSTIKNADIIYVMQDGKLFESGKHDELMEKRALYYSLVMAQMRIREEELSSNEESPHSSRLASTDDSDDESAEGDARKEIFATVIEEDEDEDDETYVEDDQNIALKKVEENETGNEEYELTENNEHKTRRKVLDKKISKSTKIEDGCEYEVTVIETTVEELYDDTKPTIEAVRTKDQIVEQKAVRRRSVNEIRRRESVGENKQKLLRRGSSGQALTDEARKKIPLVEPEPVEKDITMWEVLKMQKPECGWLGLGILGSIGVGLVTPIFAVFYGEIFRVFTLNNAELEQARIFWTIMFAVLSLFCGFVYSAQCKGMTESSEKLLLRARGQVFENILRQPIGWFDLETSTPGILINRLARNIPLIKAAAGLRTGQVLSAFATICAAFSIAFFSGWKLSLGLLVCVPIIIYVSWKQAVLLKKNQMKDALSMDHAGRVASETVRNIRTVQSLGQEMLFTKIYSDHLKEPYLEAKKQAFLYAICYATMQGVILYMYAIAFRFGGYLVEIGEMKTDNIYRVFFALSLCATSVGQSFMYLQDWNKARHATRILNYLLTRKSEIDPSLPTGAKPDIKGTVEFKRVQFRYPTRPNIRVLNRLSFKIEAGKTLALVGESGCGKSTVISLLERFYDPIAGEVLVDGFDVRTLNLQYLRSKIGIVNQEPILFDSSIKDNIAYGALALGGVVTFDQIEKAAKLANIHNFIMALPARYDTMVGERGVQLSGGQKQRVAIARALIRDPKILLLDEATSALDSESEKIVQAALDRASEGRTSIIVAHRLSTVQNADLICVVSRGEIIESGTHNELLEKQGHYYELTQRQVL